MKRKKARPPARSANELLALGQEHAQRGELAEAEARYREALALAPGHLGALSLLGFLLIDRNDAPGAIELLEQARDAAPDFPPVQLALGSAYAAAGHDELAVAAMEAAIKLDTSSTVPLERLAKHHIRSRRPREAIGLLRRVLRREPAHAQARFLLAGLTGIRPDEAGAPPPGSPTEPSPGSPTESPSASSTATPASPPPELIADLFDTYAATFDQHLLEGLQYRVPKALAALVAEVAPAPDRSWSVVDLGCGTGLAGVELVAYARTLIGSDLSQRMIARARERAIYHELHAEDLAATLARVRDIDLIVAADVFGYVGALDATIAACAAALRPGGLLAFSTERSDGDEIVLQPTLRYAHAEPYILGLARTHGLAVERAEPTILRIDHGQPVQGVLHVFRR